MSHLTLGNVPAKHRSVLRSRTSPIPTTPSLASSIHQVIIQLVSMNTLAVSIANIATLLSSFFICVKKRYSALSWD